MIKVLFVCLGNICRSPMAEFVFKDMVKKDDADIEFLVDSAATSNEESGNGIHYGTKRKLEEEGISYENHYSRKIVAKDYEIYDYIIGMEESNVRNILRIIGEDPEKKVYRLLDFTESPRDIEDPWYTGNFDKTYEDVVEGCKVLLGYLKSTINH